jgi:hypothetical protein
VLLNDHPLWTVSHVVDESKSDQSVLAINGSYLKRSPIDRPGISLHCQGGVLVTPLFDVASTNITVITLLLPGILR